MKAKIIEFGSYDYEVTRMSLLNLQVCSNCPPDEIDKIEDAVRLYSPAGTSNNWYIEREGNLSPVECENGGRWHYVFTC